jgi:glycosyltransferase involved in cell wall biosynthesis
VSHGLFISWAPFSRRTESLAERFDLDLRFVSTPWPKRPLLTPLKYPWQAVSTAAVLNGDRHDEYWVMDPPSPLVAMVGVAARRRNVSLVVDMHTVAFYAPEWKLLRRVELPALRRAAAVIVTNRGLAERVASWGARPVVLPDPLPEPMAVTDAVEEELVTIVATYSKDEPLEILPDVARRLPALRFVVTGAPHGDLSSWPDNLRPSGFLDDADYWALLARSAAIVVLTTRPDTLLSGGYEALALERPLVTSDHAVLRQYFDDAALFASATADGLAAAVADAIATGDELHVRQRALRRRREAEWRREAQALRALLGRREDARPEAQAESRAAA